MMMKYHVKYVIYVFFKYEYDRMSGIVIRGVNYICLSGFMCGSIF